MQRKTADRVVDLRTNPAVLVLFLFPLAVCLLGCEGLGGFGQKSSTTIVPDSPFGGGVSTATPATRARSTFSLTPASTAAAARVDTVGRQLLAANPQIGAKPVFSTIGTPQPALFHRGTSDVFVSEGLVRRCATDAQLAALLCHELGAMVSEREALAGGVARAADPGPPMEVRVGGDSGGPLGAPDQTRLAELGKYERERRRPTVAPTLPLDADVLARNYLTQAKLSPGELETVAPLLQEAANGAVERQMKTVPNGWVGVAPPATTPPASPGPRP